MNWWMKLFLDFALRCIDLANVAQFFWMNLMMSKIIVTLYYRCTLCITRL